MDKSFAFPQPGVFQMALHESMPCYTFLYVLYRQTKFAARRRILTSLREEIYPEQFTIPALGEYGVLNVSINYRWDGLLKRGYSSSQNWHYR